MNRRSIVPQLHSMDRRRVAAGVALVVLTTWASFIACPNVVEAADIRKNNETTNSLISGASWVGGTAPGANDTAVFDSTYAQSTTLATGGPLTWGGLKVTTGTTLVNVFNNITANFIAVGSGGVDLSQASRDLTIASFQQVADHTWSVATGRTFTLGGSLFSQTNNSVVTIVGSGTVVQSSTATLTVGDLSAFNGTLSTAGPTVLTVGSGSAFTLAGTITGASNVTKAGAGTYTLGAAERLPNTAALTISAGEFSLGGFAETVAAVTLTSGTISNGTLTGSSYALSSGDVSASLAGSGGLTKTTAGTVTLSAANTYAGDTVVSAGTLQVGNGGTSGSIGGGSIDLTGGTTLAFNRSDAVSLGNPWISLTTAGGAYTLRNDGTGLVTISNTANNISASAAAFLVLAGTGDGQFDQSIASGGGAGLGLRKQGAGTWTLTNDNNNYSGTTEISAGVLQIGNGGATGKLGAGTITLTAGATLAFDRSADISVSNAWSSFTGGGTRTLRNDGTGLVTIAASANNIGASGTAGETFTLAGSGNGVIAQSIVSAGSALALRKEGTGTWTLSNASTNYSGDTTIAAGTLEITGRLGAGSYAQAIANDGELHINSASAQTLSGVISGSGLLRKSAAGTLTLSGTNSYSGGTVLAGGTLALGSAGALGSTGTLSLAGGTLQFSASNTTDYSARFSTAAGQAYAFDTNGQTVTLGTALASSGGTLTKLGTGTLVLTAANTYDGTTTISNGTLQVTDGGSLGSGAIMLPNGTLEFTRPTATNLPNQLSVSGTGSSPALLNNGSGLLTIQPGTDTNIGADNGETFTVGGSGNIVIAKSIASGAGTSLLTKTGTGTVTLTSASNAWSGGTTISAGVLQVGDGTSNGTIGAGTITLTNGRLAFNRPNPYTVAETFAPFAAGNTPGIENNGAGLLTINASNLAFATNAELTFGGTGDGVVAGPIAAFNARASILKDGVGTWTFSGTNGYTGTTTVSAGTLEITGLIGVPNGTSTGNYSQAITNNATLHFNSAANQQISGAISGSGLLRKSAASTLTLSGTNSYTGNTTIDAGTLLVSGSGSLGSGSYAGAITNNGRLEFASSANQTLSGPLSGSGALVKGGSGRLTIAGGFSLAGEISLPDGTLEFTRSTATTLANPFNVSGIGSAPALLNNGAGLLTIQPGSSTNIGVDNGETFTVGGSGDIVIEKSIASGSGASLLTKTGSGTVTLTSTDNNWSGGTTISAGVLQVGDGTSDGAIGSGTITITNGRLAFNRPNPYTVAETIATFQAGTTPGIENNGAGLLTVNAASLVFGAVNGCELAFGGTGDGLVNGDIAPGANLPTILKTGGGTWTFNGTDNNYGATDIQAGTLEIAGTLGDFAATPNYAFAVTNAGSLRFNSALNQILSGVISGTGSLVKANTGSLTLSASNTFTGLVRVEGGTLALGGSGLLAPAVPVEINGGSFDIAGKTQTISALNGTGGTVALGAGSLSIANATANAYAGAINGTGALVKSGLGNLVLSGTSDYTGATTVSAGRLSVNGALGTSPVTVLALAELGGSGSIAGPVSVHGGGTLSPGNSIASFATGTTSFAAGATFEYEVDSSNVNSLFAAADLLVVNGNLDITSGALLTLDDLNETPNQFIAGGTIFAMINYSGTWNGGLFTYSGEELSDGELFQVGDQEWQIDYNRTSPIGLDNFTSDYVSGNFVTITAVPEPSTLVLTCLGGAIAAWAARRRE